MRIAAARVLEAAAQLGVTRSFLLPTVDGTAEVGRDRVSEARFLPPPPGGSSVGNTFALGLALTWEVDVWGRIRRQTEWARADLLAAEWARRAVLVTVISQVASAYFVLRGWTTNRRSRNARWRRGKSSTLTNCAGAGGVHGP